MFSLSASEVILVVGETVCLQASQSLVKRNHLAGINADKRRVGFHIFSLMLLYCDEPRTANHTMGS